MEGIAVSHNTLSVGTHGRIALERSTHREFLTKNILQYDYFFNRLIYLRFAVMIVLGNLYSGKSLNQN